MQDTHNYSDESARTARRRSLDLCGERGVCYAGAPRTVSYVAAEVGIGSDRCKQAFAAGEGRQRELTCAE
jgi:hypothetical protein